MSTGSCSNSVGGECSYSGRAGVNCHDSLRPLLALQLRLGSLRSQPCLFSCTPIPAAGPVSVFTPSLLTRAVGGPETGVINYASLRAFEIVMSHNQNDLGFAVRFWHGRARGADLNEELLARELLRAVQNRQAFGLDEGISLMLLNCVKYLAVTSVTPTDHASDIGKRLEFLLKPGVPENLRAVATETLILTAYQHLQFGHDLTCYNHLQPLLSSPLPNEAVAAKAADLLAQFVQQASSAELRTPVLNHLIANARYLFEPGASAAQLTNANRLLIPLLRRLIELADLDNGEWYCLRALVGTLLTPVMVEIDIGAAEVAVLKDLVKAAELGCPVAASLQTLATQNFSHLRRIAAVPGAALTHAESIPILRYAEMAKLLTRPVDVAFLREHEAFIQQVTPYLSLKGRGKFLFWLVRSILANNDLPQSDRLFAWRFVPRQILPQADDDLPGIDDLENVLFFFLEQLASNADLPRPERDLARNIVLETLNVYVSHPTRSGRGVNLLNVVAGLATNERLAPDERRCYREALRQPRMVQNLFSPKYVSAKDKTPFSAGTINQLVPRLRAINDQAVTKEMIHWLNGIAITLTPDRMELRDQVLAMRKAAQANLLQMAQDRPNVEPSLWLDVLWTMADILFYHDVLTCEEQVPAALFCLQQELLASRSHDEEVHSCLVHILGFIAEDGRLPEVAEQALRRILDLIRQYPRLPAKAKSELIFAVSRVTIASRQTDLVYLILQAADHEDDASALASIIDLLAGSYLISFGNISERKRLQKLLLNFSRRFSILPPKAQKQLVQVLPTLANKTSDAELIRTLSEVGRKIISMRPPNEELLVAYTQALCNAEATKQTPAANLEELFRNHFLELPKEARKALLSYLNNPLIPKQSQVLDTVLQETLSDALDAGEITVYASTVAGWVCTLDAADDRRKAQTVFCHLARSGKIASHLLIPTIESVNASLLLPLEEKLSFLRNVLTSPELIRFALTCTPTLRHSLTLLATDALARREPPAAREEKDKLVALILGCSRFLEEPESVPEQRELIECFGKLSSELLEASRAHQQLRTAAQEFLHRKKLSKILGSEPALRTAMIAAYSQILGSPNLSPAEKLPFLQKLASPAALNAMLLSSNTMDRLASFHLLCQVGHAEREPTAEQQIILEFLANKEVSERLFTRLETVTPETLDRTLTDLTGLNNRNLLQQFIIRLVKIAANGAKGNPTIQQAAQEHLNRSPHYLLQLFQIWDEAAAAEEGGITEEQNEQIAQLLSKESAAICLNHPDSRTRQIYIDLVGRIAARPMLSLDEDNEQLLQDMLLQPNFLRTLLSLPEPNAVLLTLRLLGRILEDPTLSPTLTRLLPECFIPYFSRIEDIPGPAVSELLQKIKQAISRQYPGLLPAPTPADDEDITAEAEDSFSPADDAPLPPPQVVATASAQAPLPNPPAIIRVGTPTSPPPPLAEQPIVGILPVGNSITNPAETIVQPGFLERDLERIRQFRRVKYHPLQLQLNKLRDDARDALRKRRGGKKHRELVQQFFRVREQLKRQVPRPPDKWGRHDNTNFTNVSIRDGQPLLPIKPAGYYTEYLCTPGEETDHRLVIGENGEVYYTSGHYERGTFYSFGYLRPPTPPPKGKG